MSAPSIIPAAPDVPPESGPTGDPPSLRRRAPARIVITLKSGRCPSMTGGRTYVQARQRLLVQVVPQDASARVEIAADFPLRALIPTSRIVGGVIPTYYAEFLGASQLRFYPIPRTGYLFISIIDGQQSPYRLTIPITVRPAIVLWWLGMCALIVANRLRRIAEDSDSFAGILRAARDDLPFILELLLLGSLVILPALWLIGWVFTSLETRDAKD